MPGFSKRNSIDTKKLELSEKQSNIWNSFNESVNLLKQRFPDQFAELEKASRRVPLQSQFEKIIFLT
jgi:hypothetical protein